MDELSQITEYIQAQSGDECEVIFGHGVDATLGNSIRVTVIATGFAGETKAAPKKREKKVLDLEKSQSVTTEVADNSVNERNHDIELKLSDEMFYADPVKEEPLMDFEEKYTAPPTPQQPEKKIEEVPVMKQADEVVVPKKTEEKPIYVKPVEKPFKKEETPLEERHYTLSLFDEPAITAKNDDDDDEDDDISHAKDDDEEFEVGKEISSDQVINEEGMMEVRKTKARLEQQAKERRERLKQAKKNEMSKEEFNEKWTLPAYLRRGVKMENVPHSSERFISKYNLNDDNNLLGNNKFLHDNVD